jgi:hypothetical protein
MKYDFGNAQQPAGCDAHSSLDGIEIIARVLDAGNWLSHRYGRDELADRQRSALSVKLYCEPDDETSACEAIQTIANGYWQIIETRRYRAGSGLS